MPVTDSFKMTDVSADLQDYALDHQEHIVADVFEIGMGGIEGTPIVALDSYVNVMPAKGEVVLTDLITGDPMQPGNKGAFNPKDNYGALKTRKAKPESVKVDLLFKEQKIKALYDTYMARVRGLRHNPEELPFEEWLISRLNQDVQKYIRLAFFNAVLNPVGTSSADLFDGIVEQISNTITNTPADINTVDMGVRLSELTVDNIVNTIRKLPENMPANFTYGENSVLVVSKAIHDLYEKGYQKVHGNLNYNGGFRKLQIDGTNIDIVVEDGVTAFATPFVATKDNLALLYDTADATVDFDYQKRDRSLAYLMDFKAGAGIAATERIWVAAFTPEV